MKYKLTQAAREHLSDIWRYTVKRWSEIQAEKYLRELEAKLEQLGANPDLGKHRPEIHEGYYSFPVEHHVIYYLKAPDHIQIIGILHGRMDTTNRLT